MAWARWAACRDHPVLGPDAWFDMDRGNPQAEGVEAIAVCMTECAVMMECREAMFAIGARDQVAGGGWFDPKGHFHRLSSIENARKWRARRNREKRKLEHQRGRDVHPGREGDQQSA